MDLDEGNGEKGKGEQPLRTHTEFYNTLCSYKFYKREYRVLKIEVHLRKQEWICEKDLKSVLCHFVNLSSTDSGFWGLLHLGLGYYDLIVELYYHIAVCTCFWVSKFLAGGPLSSRE